MSSSALPPPGNLPSWSRVSTFDRSRYPRPFLRDRVPPTDLDTSVDVRFLEKVSVQHRMVNHDKNVKFLQDQHTETLQKLHQELEALKKENKELKFKVIVAQTNSNPSPETHSETRAQSVPSDIKTILLQEEIKDLRQTIKDANSKNAELKKVVFTLQSQLEHQQQNNDSLSENIGQRKPHRRRFSVSNLSSHLPLNATLNPLQVRDTAESAPRVPSLTECELIIRHLHKTNSLHLAELSRLRSERPLTPSSRNSTPEPQISKSLDSATAERKLPRIPTKPKVRKPIRSASTQEMAPTLPMVVTSSSANLLDRRKRRSMKTITKNDSESK